MEVNRLPYPIAYSTLVPSSIPIEPGLVEDSGNTSADVKLEPNFTVMRLVQHKTERKREYGEQRRFSRGTPSGLIACAGSVAARPPGFRFLEAELFENGEHLSLRNLQEVNVRKASHHRLAQTNRFRDCA